MANTHPAPFLTVGDQLFDTHGLPYEETVRRIEARGLIITDRIRIFVDSGWFSSVFPNLVEDVTEAITGNHRSYLNKFLVVLSEDHSRRRLGYILAISYDGNSLTLFRVESTKQE